MLFLFNDHLNPAALPDIYVMLVAWYGMVPTRNRSCYAVECIAEETMIEAKDALMYQLYVDDLLRVADTTEDQEDQIQQMEALLANSGFKLKFFTCLGQLLCNEGSSNGKTMKVLGYSWFPESNFFCWGCGSSTSTNK